MQPTKLPATPHRNIVAQGLRQTPLWKAALNHSPLPLLLAAVCVVAFHFVGNALYWPLRIIIAASALWGLYLLPRDIMRWGSWAGAVFERSWAAACRWCHRPPAKWLFVFIEIIAAGAIMYIALLQGGKVAEAMAASSLREDEISAIDQYHSQSPLSVVTTYNLAKNHVFYSLTNSLTPGSDSYEPFRARLLSFMAMGLLLLLGFLLFARRLEIVEGAIFVFFIAINSLLLELTLEARGYGFITLFAGVSVLLLRNYLAAKKGQGLGALVGLAVCTWLGTYTVPFYILVGGFFMLAAFFLRPQTRALLAGVMTLVVIGLSYTPIISEVMKVTQEYEAKYDLRFTSIDRIYMFLRYYVFPKEMVTAGPMLLLSLTAAICLVVAFFRHPRNRATVSACLVASAAVFGFLIYCLHIQTPPMRVTAFLAGPAAVAIAFWFSMIYRNPRLVSLRPILCLGVAALLWTGGQRVYRAYEFYPTQDWLMAGRMIEAVAPEGGKVWFPGEYEPHSAAYLNAAQHQLIDAPLPPPAVLHRELVLFDNTFRKKSDGPVPLTSNDLPETIRYVTIPLRFNYHRIFFFPLPLEERSIENIFAQTATGERPLPLRAELPQPYDPFLLFPRGWGDHFHQVPALLDVLNSPQAMGAYRLATAVPLDDETLNQSEIALPAKLRIELPQNRNVSTINLLFSQSMEDKIVSVKVNGKERKAQPRGEFLQIKMAEGESEVMIEIEQSDLATFRNTKTLTQELEDDAITRPPFFLVEAWANRALDESSTPAKEDDRIESGTRQEGAPE